ncbi:MAG: nitric-oxide reductase [Rhodocyclales bacterium]|nr:MAG: nitric-oxide reductase [Rhodocyclales bacterium]
MDTGNRLGNLWNRLVMDRRNWWLPLAVVMVIGMGSMIFVGTKTYDDAPPIPDFVDAEGRPVVTQEAILRGQLAFQRYALMDYGSMFGDGAARGVDFTADALHRTAEAMLEHYAGPPQTENGTAARQAALARVQAEIKANRYDAATNRVTLSEGQAVAYEALVRHYAAMFRGEGPEAFHPAGYISDAQEIRELAAFFFWGGWVCGAQRPGVNYSYTHNWPYDELAGNRPGAPVMLWSVIAALALVLCLGVVLFLYGRYSRMAGWRSGGGQENLATVLRVEGWRPSGTQRAAYRFFAAAGLLFVLQIVAGVLTVHDFIGFTTFFGKDIAEALPLTITRGWHIQLALLWITACWIGASVFVLSAVAEREPAGQSRLVNLLFAMVVVLVAGMLVGVFMGPKNLLGEYWNLLGNQGWEFVELGRLWQVLLMAVFVLWAVIIWRGVRGVWRQGDAWIMPKWLFYTVLSIVLLFLSAFVAKPTTNFVVADFWRWAVIHMWAEAFFEVFTTVLLAYFMVMMGLVSHTAASRIVYLATLLFLGSGLLGISHNFYWNAKPVETLAIGSVFSTLQVVPLILLTLEAWEFRKTPERSMQGEGAQRFGQHEAFLFLLGVNFWNFLGAGVFGFIINLPIVNYYEHGTYLTVNHGHAALMGVYGNLALAAVLFCSRYLVAPGGWNSALLRRAFWSINLGLLLMVVIDLFPVGIHQLATVLEDGYWQARSQAYIEGAVFQTLTWARVVGGALFVLGGVLPIAWFLLSRLRRLKPATAQPQPEAVAKEGEVLAK